MSAPVPCLVHGVGPDEPCSLVEPACAARLARMANPLVSLFRSMASAAVEASAIEIAPPIFEAPPVADEPIELSVRVPLSAYMPTGPAIYCYEEREARDRLDAAGIDADAELVTLAQELERDGVLDATEAEILRGGRKC